MTMKYFKRIPPAHNIPDYEENEMNILEVINQNIFIFVELYTQSRLDY